MLRERAEFRVVRKLLTAARYAPSDMDRANLVGYVLHLKKIYLDELADIQRLEEKLKLEQTADGGDDNDKQGSAAEPTA